MAKSTAIDMHNIISSNEAINIIETSARELFNDPTKAFEIPAILLRGAPGIGKSSIIKQVAKRLKVEYRDVRLAELERVDIAGLPSINNGETVWNVPSFLPKDPKSKGILLLDELTSAPADVQVAAYALILDRCIPNANYRLPDGWFIVAAGNRTIDRAVAKTMSSALANRFVHFEMDSNAEDWTIWAAQNSIDPSVVGFINYRPDNLFKMDGQNLEQGWPSPRAWEKVSNMIKLFGSNPQLFQKIVYGLVGNGVGVEYMAFFKLNKKTENVIEWLTNPKAKITLPSRADELYAIVSAAAYHVWNGADEKEDAKRVEGLYRIAMGLTPDFATVLIRTVLAGNKRVSAIKAIQLVAKSPSRKKFIDKFGAKLNEQFSLAA